jgi:hypothetical protein
MGKETLLVYVKAFYRNLFEIAEESHKISQSECRIPYRVSNTRPSWKLQTWIHVALTLHVTASTKSSLNQNENNALVLTQLVDNMFCRLNLSTIDTVGQVAQSV